MKTSRKSDVRMNAQHSILKASSKRKQISKTFLPIVGPEKYSYIVVTRYF